MHRVIVYKAQDKYFSFRCSASDGGEGLASAMGEIIFSSDAPTAKEASNKARAEAIRRGIREVDSLLAPPSTL